ncbi:hypothetical protein ACVGOW_10015 [Pseudonocardia saturnea]
MEQIAGSGAFVADPEGPVSDFGTGDRADRGQARHAELFGDAGLWPLAVQQVPR